MQMGYNLLYGLHKASYDADCSLFLGVLRGDVKEDVYIQTAQLQVILMFWARLPNAWRDRLIFRV